MANKTKITPEICEIIKTMAIKGDNPTAIGKAVNLAKDTVKNYLIKNNLPVHKRTSSKTTDKVNEIIKFLPQAKHLKEIEDKFQIDHRALLKLIQNTEYSYLIRSRSDVQLEKVLSEEEVNKRVHPNKFVEYEAGTKKYVLTTPDGFVFKKNISHLDQGDPRGKNGSVKSVDYINKILQNKGYLSIEDRPKNLKDRYKYIHGCGNEIETKFSWIANNKVTCRKCFTRMGFQRNAVSGLSLKRPDPTLLNKSCRICKNNYATFKKSDGDICSEKCKQLIIKTVKKTNSYSQEQIDRIKGLFYQNKSSSEISKDVLVSITFVKKVIKNEKAKLNGDPNKQIYWENKKKEEENIYNQKILQIKKMAEEGKGTITHLSKTFEVPATTVLSDFKKKGWGHLINVNSSGPQLEMTDFIKSIYSQKIKSEDRIAIYPHHLDISLPDIGLGIEFNGLYFHSDRNPQRGSGYHLMKLEKCRKIGYRLIQVFEDEWLNKKDQIKGYLKSVIGANNNRIAARKCNVLIIDSEIAKKFCNLYHIQGAPNHSKLSIGVYYQDELIGVMCFSNHHRNRNQNPSEIVLSRMVFKDGFSVIGGASKMLKKAITELKNTDYSTIISWSDNRWSDGNVYEKMGFFMETEYKPDYCYTKGSTRINKQRMNKKQLIKMGAKEGTESEMAASLGYYKIYDCGKKKWTFYIN